MTLKDRYFHIVSWFLENRPDAATELQFDGTPFQLLVAVMLSAQCTDRRVNQVTPALFAAFPGPQQLAAASFDEVYPYIKSVSYPNSKTTHLIAAAGKIVSDFGGQVPGTIEELMTLPGVGRKTANVVASILFDEPVIAVDTHVFRVSRRLGLSRGRTVEAVEKDLERHIPEQHRPLAHHWLILHGRYVCTARHPHCTDCPLQPWCQDFATRKV